MKRASDAAFDMAAQLLTAKLNVAVGGRQSARRGGDAVTAGREPARRGRLHRQEHVGEHDDGSPEAAGGRALARHSRASTTTRSADRIGHRKGRRQRLPGTAPAGSEILQRPSTLRGVAHYLFNLAKGDAAKGQRPRAQGSRNASPRGRLFRGRLTSRMDKMRDDRRRERARLWHCDVPVHGHRGLDGAAQRSCEERYAKALADHHRILRRGVRGQRRGRDRQPGRLVLRRLQAGTGSRACRRRCAARARRNTSGRKACRFAFAWASTRARRTLGRRPVCRRVGPPGSTHQRARSWWSGARVETDDAVRHDLGRGPA